MYLDIWLVSFYISWRSIYFRKYSIFREICLKEKNSMCHFVVCRIYEWNWNRCCYHIDHILIKWKCFRSDYEQICIGWPIFEQSRHFGRYFFDFRFFPSCSNTISTWKQTNVAIILFHCWTDDGFESRRDSIDHINGRKDRATRMFFILSSFLLHRQLVWKWYTHILRAFYYKTENETLKRA